MNSFGAYFQFTGLPTAKKYFKEARIQQFFAEKSTLKDCKRNKTVQSRKQESLNKTIQISIIMMTKPPK